MIDAEDHREIRCRRLGHPVSFRYCRSQEGNQLCQQILNCWWEQFDVHAFLSENLGEEECRRLVAPKQQQHKVVGILELIARAKKSKKDKKT